MSMQKYYIKLWIKFIPEFQRTPDGTAIHKNKYNGTEAGRKKAMQQFFPYLNRLKQEDKIWQARLYDSLDNSLLYQWTKSQ